jgi:hypothetical protein
VRAVLGTMLVPGLLDRLLSRRAYEGQMTAEPAPAGTPDNLFQPVPGHQGVHGRFGARAKAGVVSVNPVILRAGLAGALVVVIGLAAAAGRAVRPGRRLP